MGCGCVLDRFLRAGGRWCGWLAAGSVFKFVMRWSAAVAEEVWLAVDSAMLRRARLFFSWHVAVGVGSDAWWCDLAEVSVCIVFLHSTSGDAVLLIPPCLKYRVSFTSSLCG